ncbi:hypothetical protein ACQ1PL_03350 [Ornithobacterium rhinotracheale]
MKRKITKISIMLLLLNFSCGEKEDFLEKKNPNVDGFVLENVTQKAEGLNKATFSYDGREVDIFLTKEKNRDFSFDMDGDGSPDLKIEPIKEDYSEVYYLDGVGNKLSRAKISFENGVSTIEILEKYENKKDMYARGGWRSCFERSAGSAEGISATVMVSFMGPEAVAALYAGMAVGCLF